MIFALTLGAMLGAASVLLVQQYIGDVFRSARRVETLTRRAAQEDKKRVNHE